MATQLENVGRDTRRAASERVFPQVGQAQLYGIDRGAAGRRGRGVLVGAEISRKEQGHGNLTLSSRGARRTASRTSSRTETTGHPIADSPIGRQTGACLRRHVAVAACGRSGSRQQNGSCLVHSKMRARNLTETVRRIAKILLCRLRGEGGCLFSGGICSGQLLCTSSRDGLAVTFHVICRGASPFTWRWRRWPTTWHSSSRFDGSIPAAHMAAHLRMLPFAFTINIAALLSRKRRDAALRESEKTVRQVSDDRAGRQPCCQP